MIQHSPETLTNSLAGDWIELTTWGGAVMWVDVREVVYCDAEDHPRPLHTVAAGNHILTHGAAARAGSESPGGETGRCAGLKILWRFTFRVGSTPTPGTRLGESGCLLSRVLGSMLLSGFVADYPYPGHARNEPATSGDHLCWPDTFDRCGTESSEL